MGVDMHASSKDLSGDDENMLNVMPGRCCGRWIKRI